MEEERNRGRSSRHRARNVDTHLGQMDSNLYNLEQCVFVAPPSPEPPPRPTSLTSPRLSPAGSGRSQPEGSSGSETPLPSTQLSVRPLSPVGASAPDRFQPEGSPRIHPVGSPVNPRSESGRSQPEGSCPGLLSPIQQYRPLPPPPPSPHRSPVPSPRGSPERRRSSASLTSTGSQEPCLRSNATQHRPQTTDRLLFNDLPIGSSQEKNCEDFRIYLMTWNVGCSVPPSDLTSLLCLNAGDGKTDVFVIGYLKRLFLEFLCIQPEEAAYYTTLCITGFEVTLCNFTLCHLFCTYYPHETLEDDTVHNQCLISPALLPVWEIKRLQEVNSMINKRLKDALFSDQWSEVFMDVLSPFSYVLVSSVRMQGCLLLVFAKYFHLPFLRDVQTDCTRTGLGGYWGNKGGVSIRLSLFGHMLCFLNCHLPAHMENSDQRVDNFESILQLQQFEGPMANGVLDHDLVFWFGDLNFRIEDLDLHFVKSAIQGNKLSLLWEKDQLNMAKCYEPVLSGFMEGPLTFPPTYKYDVGTNTYDTSSKKRKPAWTDRILWKMKDPTSHIPAAIPGMGNTKSEKLSVTLLSYGSHMQYTESDHKPVSAIFSLKFCNSHTTPLVSLWVRDEWLQPVDACVTYRWSPVYMKSSWDWIGLYKLGFRHHKDYVAYVWAKSEEEINDGRQHQVMFGEESLPKGIGEYLLGYYSNNLGTLIGVTEPFQISLPGSDTNTPSDSSDSSSEEEDSTHVLLRPKSRSPSPATARSPRSRSPALARLHDLILPNSSRQKSRSPSPHRAKSPRHERPRRSRSRDATSERKGTKGHHSHQSQSIPVPIPRPAVMGYNPKENTVTSPQSQKSNLQAAAPSHSRDPHT